MKQLIAVALLAAVAVADHDYEAMFKAFKTRHAKVYASEAEEAKRFATFTQNMKQAEVLQTANPLATFGATVHADRTAAELKSLHNSAAACRKAVAQREERLVSRMSAAERAKSRGTSVDWRKKGAVGPVINQGDCGSAWAISAAGNIEGIWAAAGNEFVSASVQELVSCDDVNGGCSGGGVPQSAYAWLLTNTSGKIATAASFPYGSESSCPEDPASLPVAARIKGYTNIASSEDAMAAYTFANGPIAVVVDATSWEMYTGGIMTNCISQQPNMVALVVGYDDTSVPPYWIIKNSWGTNWGEEGYIRIQKGSNQCLINSLPTSATL